MNNIQFRKFESYLVVKIFFAGAAAPACVTATVRVIPPPVTVIVPVLAAVLVFAAALIVRVPLFDPLAGVTVNQDAALLLAVHDTLEVTVTLVLAAAAPGFHVEADRVRAGAAIVTVTVYAFVLVSAAVTVYVTGLVKFCAAPEAGLTLAPLCPMVGVRLVTFVP